MRKISEILKETSDKRITETLKDSFGLFFMNYSGANSADMTHLRRDLKKCGARMFVTKNSFINAALKNAEQAKDVAGFIEGPTALIFVNEDPVSPSKILFDFSKTHSSIKLCGGFLEDRIVESSEFKMLASIPPKEVLRQQLACALNGPVTKLAVGLNQVVAKLAYALKALSDKKGNENK